MATATKVTESPTAWFAVLERARMAGDYALAERATKELHRLGVEITFHAQDKSEPTSDA